MKTIKDVNEHFEYIVIPYIKTSILEKVDEYSKNLSFLSYFNEIKHNKGSNSNSELIDFNDYFSFHFNYDGSISIYFYYMFKELMDLKYLFKYKNIHKESFLNEDDKIQISKLESSQDFNDFSYELFKKYKSEIEKLLISFEPYEIENVFDTQIKQAALCLIQTRFKNFLNHNL